MNTPTHGQPLVQPDDVVARIDALIPIDQVHAVPLVWNARNIDLQVLIDARNEIKRLRAGGCARNQGLTQHCAEAAAAHAEIERLRARVEHLEREMRFIGRLDYPPTRLSAQNRARAALTALRKLKP